MNGDNEVILSQYFHSPTRLPSMLSTSSAALMTLGTAIVLFLPGPTNTLFATAGLTRGVRHSAHLIGAEFAGYLVAISVWGYVLSHAAASLAWLPVFLRLASSVYLAYLAVRMWQTANAFPSETQRTIGLRTLFTATLLNPKAILFAGTIFPAVAFQSTAAYLEAMTIFTILLIPSGFAWIAFGAALGSGRLVRINPVHVQRCASIVLAGFSLSLVWAVLH
jgi:threonine/homoserine/homoserine lactone efflux protein